MKTKIDDSTYFSFQVHWVQQQHEKKRKKRDYADSSYFGEFPRFLDEFSSPERPSIIHRQRNRGTPFQSLFTDPLFKEEWYLVSDSKIFRNFIITKFVFNFK